MTITFAGEIDTQNTGTTGDGGIGIIFRSKVGWLSSEPMQIFMSRKDALKLGFQFDSPGNLTDLEFRKITVLIHV